jgi:hypothetical protein
LFSQKGKNQQTEIQEGAEAQEPGTSLQFLFEKRNDKKERNKKKKKLFSSWETVGKDQNFLSDLANEIQFKALTLFFFFFLCIL